MSPIVSGWEIKKISELSENVFAGATPNTKIREYWENGNIPWMSSGEINNEIIQKTTGFITKEGFKNSSTKMVPINSVLIALAGQGKTRGKVAVNKIELCTNQSLAAIVPNKRLYYTYLFYSLQYRYLELRELSSGDGGRGGLNLKLINSIKIDLPPLPEQKKIAEILSTWDEAIELTKKKHSELFLLKKGVAQKIINNSEWKKVPLRDLLKKKNTISVPNSNQYLEIGDVDIRTKKYTLKEKPPVKGAVLAPNGSILISTVRPTRGAITMISDNLLVSSAFVIVDLLPTVSKTFIFSQLNSEKFLNNMGRLSTGSTYPTVNREDVLSYKVLVPHIEEQDSISEIMDNLTKSLNLLETKIDLLKLQKQGLMQRLLTGKVRVKLD